MRSTSPVVFPLLSPALSGSAPGYSFAANPGTGMYNSGNTILFASASTGSFGVALGFALINNAAVYGWSSDVSTLGGSDVQLARDAAAVLALKNGTNPQTFRVYGTTTGPKWVSLSHNGTTFGILDTDGSNGVSLRAGGVECVAYSASASLFQFTLGLTNGQNLTLNQLSELTTIAAAATTDTALSIPVNSIVLAVSVRTTVTIPTAATYTVTATVGGTQFNTAAVSTTAGNTDPGTKAGAFFASAATQVRFTPNATPGTNAGRVRVTVYYLTSNPPTS